MTATPKLNRDRKMYVTEPFKREGDAVMLIENEGMPPFRVLVRISLIDGGTLIEADEVMAVRDDGHFAITHWWLDQFDFAWLSDRGAAEYP